MERFSTAVEQPLLRSSNSQSKEHRAILLLSSVLGLIAVGLLVYSQVKAFVWDEGFHLLAAQLIDNGKTPYLDFCFPQTPLNTYWNAAWMHVFGQNWRITHFAAALLVVGAVILTSQFVFTRFPVQRWRLACALTAAVLVGLNSLVVQFGPIAQAYAMGLFLIVVAFRLTIAAPNEKSWLSAAGAGFFAGAAAGSTLLTAAAAPVFLVWIWFYNRNGNRWTKSAAFLIGALIPFAPVLWLFAKAPQQVLFNVVQYQALYRRVKWTGATPHDVDVLSAWLDSSQALLMGLLAAAGLWFVARERKGHGSRVAVEEANSQDIGSARFARVSQTSDWDRARRGEFYLCGALSIALILYIATAHPTFTRYFVFAVPFVSILAVVGLYFIGSRLVSPSRPFGPAAFLIALVTLSLARDLFDDRDAVTWSQYEQIARKIEQVTPPRGVLLADEHVYFLTRRPPPSGLEFSYSHQLDLPPAQEALYHVASQKELNEQVKAGRFDTVESCNDDRIEEMNLVKLFRHKADIGDCSIFWGKAPQK